MNNEKNKSADSPFQTSLPADVTEYPRGLYDDAPAFSPSAGSFTKGYAALADKIASNVPAGLRLLAVDGYHGVDWAAFQKGLADALSDQNLAANWLNMADCLASPEVIESKLAPFLGGDDPLFGKQYPLGIETFFDPENIANYRIQASIARGRKSGSLTIIYGCGAGLLELWDQLWYVDISKMDIQFAARKMAVANLGADRPVAFGKFYKRSYFVEWPALNRQKRMLLPEIDLFADGQSAEAPTACSGETFRAALREIAENPFRARPWFLPGPWGGKFTQGHMGQDPTQPNMAWSYELITPENGILLEKENIRMECSFDWLMYQENQRVMGPEAARQFKYEWPLRLDYLDTIDGGNLSTQVHPRPDYIREHFGETFTQDETYYITNAKPDARVYLGLKEDCQPEEFRKALEASQQTGSAVDIGQFVHSEPAKPHDLFLIPSGTVHCSGRGNLVLEISAMPYIFTFKLYDYLRKDLEGNLRPMNIPRGFENISFTRRESWVRDNLLAKPQLLSEGDDWQEYVLLDNEYFFYAVHRAEFETEYILDTKGRAFAVNLVEGQQVQMVSASGRETRLSYLESMIIPAASTSVKIINNGKTPCKLILVYIKPGTGVSRPVDGKPSA